MSNNCLSPTYSYESMSGRPPGVPQTIGDDLRLDTLWQSKANLYFRFRRTATVDCPDFDGHQSASFGRNRHSNDQKHHVSPFAHGPWWRDDRRDSMSAIRAGSRDNLQERFAQLAAETRQVTSNRFGRFLEEVDAAYSLQFCG